jgi:hypothetical protein
MEIIKNPDVDPVRFRMKQKIEYMAPSDKQPFCRMLSGPIPDSSAGGAVALGTIKKIAAPL